MAGYMGGPGRDEHGVSEGTWRPSLGVGAPATRHAHSVGWLTGFVLFIGWLLEFYVLAKSKVILVTVHTHGNIIELAPLGLGPGHPRHDLMSLSVTLS